ncbi:MAG: hypothetical protein HOH66_15965 [Rhodospirillaceae bacterium]|nr:hypothetical protein [Rhodospirillaceae bacterium]
MTDYNSELLVLPAADDPALVDQFFRTLGYAYYGVADVAEVYAIGHRLPPGDAQGQYETWRAAANRYLEIGERKLAAGHKVSARRAFLRAAEYHRASHFQLRENLWDPAVLAAVEDMARAADAGYALAANYEARRIAIPFEGKELLGVVFARGGEWSVRRPTIFAITGYDSFVEEYYQIAAVEDAIARGYNVAIVDGPGQGHTLLRHRLFMRPDYEAVLPPCLDWLSEQGFAAPDRIAVLGRSFGGYLVPRGLLGEERPCAMIVDPGQISFRDALLGRMPEAIGAAFEAGDRKTVDGFFAKAMASKPGLRFFFMSRAAVHGCTTPFDYLVEMMRFDFRYRAGEITVPAFVTDNPHDFATRGKHLYDALVKVETKTLVQFETAEPTAETRTGGGAHCEQGYNLPFEMAAFDWLSDLIVHKDEG